MYKGFTSAWELTYTIFPNSSNFQSVCKLFLKNYNTIIRKKETRAILKNCFGGAVDLRKKHKQTRYKNMCLPICQFR